jgi:lysine-N-methylase
MELPGEMMFDEEEENEEYEEDDEKKVFLEQVQTEAIAILQNRSKSIELRMQEYLSYLTWIQEKINRTDVDAGESLAYTDEELEEDILVCEFSLLEPSFEQYEKRMDIFTELEVLDQEWENVKKNLKTKLSSSTYNDYFLAFSTSDAYLDRDYENLLVYFTFRYFMNSYYNLDVLSYGKLAVVFTLMLRDMDMVRFDENGGAFSRADRVDTARIFSKEVEHSEENVEYVREELMFL